MRRFCSFIGLFTGRGWLVAAVACSFVITPTPAVADESALTTASGTPRKVITKFPTALYRSADPASENEPVDVFRFFYILPSERGGSDDVKDGFFRVAYGAEAPRQAGWVKVDSVVEWPHAQVAGFTSFGSRQRVLFYPTAADAIAAYQGQADPTANAISREPAQKQQALFPLLSVDTFKADGDQVELFEMAYLSSQSPAQRSPTQTSPNSSLSSTVVTQTTRKIISEVPTTRSELQRDFKLQVTFVIDSTASMTAWIDAMKNVIATVSSELGGTPSLSDRIEFGLVTYRDQLAAGSPDLAAMQYVSQTVCDLTPDHSLFQQRLATVTAAEVPSEETAEDVLAGLYTALNDVAWKPAAHKVIVLIGDAPAHVNSEGYKNVTRQTIPGIVALAQPTGSQATFDQVQLHGLRIVSDEAALADQHFSELTAGRQHPGLHYAYEGEADAARFTTDLVARLSDLATATQQIAEGRFDDLAADASQAAPDSSQARLLGPVMEMLRVTEASGDAQTFERGFAVVLDPEGNRALEPHVLANRAQLKLFASGVHFIITALEDSGDPGSRDVTKLVSKLQLLTTGVNLKEDIHPDTPLSEVLSHMLGFPVRNSVFEMTPKKLAGMTAADYQRWVDQVQASQSIIQAHLDNGSLWFQLGQGKRAHEVHAFIKVSDLP